MIEQNKAQKRSITGRFFASKGTRTDCGGSAYLSAVVDCASCYATTNIGRVLATQASLELTLTPYSTPSVSPPNQTTLVCSRSAERSSSPGVQQRGLVIYLFCVKFFGFSSTFALATFARLVAAVTIRARNWTSSKGRFIPTFSIASTTLARTTTKMTVNTHVRTFVCVVTRRMFRCSTIATTCRNTIATTIISRWIVCVWLGITYCCSTSRRFWLY